ncbi:Hypothetical protein HVR_LOCUS1048 [uncultured virus]|nr:Hypothetical protein HVR_LOCUS1048 [uncultured virus]
MWRFGRPGDEKIIWTKDCAQCETPALAQYQAQYSSYYRNKSAGNFNFCSAECQDCFIRTKMCYYCYYPDDLKYIEDKNFMLCTDRGRDPSCYDKYYQLDKKYYYWVIFSNSEGKRYYRYESDDSAIEKLWKLIKKFDSDIAKADIEVNKKYTSGDTKVCIEVNQCKKMIFKELD